jgi:type VI secretion system secreted protein VgrG
MLGLDVIRTVTASGPALPESSTDGVVLQLASVSGEEHLSKLYEYTVGFLTPLESAMSADEAANLDLKAMIGKELTVTVQLDGMGSFVPGRIGLSGGVNVGEGAREISGIVTQARFAGRRGRQCHYLLTMKPWIYLADQRSDYRIFQRKTVIEIIDEVLAAYSYSYDKRTSARYADLAYQVQYGETDFCFIQRLMAEHGIYWFFEHSNGVHRMVLVDHVGAHQPVESAAYHTLWYYPPGHKIDREYVNMFDARESIQSGRWATSDFNFEKPKANLAARNDLPRDTAHNAFERYEWPGDYSDPAQGEQIARLRMEEVRAQSERVTGSGNVRDVVCGTTFTLAGYPQASANREYLVICARFAATEASESSGSGEYRIGTSFVAQPSTTVYRPPRDIPKPRTRGPQTAIVTGPAGQEIWTDQYGRVKLKFHWDRSGVNDHNSSCWVRVSYPWAGSNFGAINIPRVGTEVIVDFENGDPDRPIVTGRVYNAMTMPPWNLPDNATQSGMLSRSMKGHYGTANAIRFEDKQGEEELWLQAEKDMRTEVESDEIHSVGVDRTKTVGHDELVHIGHDRTETVDRNETVMIGADRTETVACDENLTVGGSRHEKIGGSQSLVIVEASAETVGLAKALTVGAGYGVTVGGAMNTAIGLASSEQVGLSKNTMVGKTYSITAGSRFELKVGKAMIVLEDNGNISISGTKLTIDGSGPVRISGNNVDINS